MTLKNISLPSFVLANLYKYSIVDFKKNQQKIIHPGIDIFFLGGNKKHILLLVNNPEVKFLPNSQLNFLSEILSACSLSMEDIAIVNIHQTKTVEILPKKDIPQILNSEVIILSGVDLSMVELPFNIPQFQVQMYMRRSYLLIPSLEEIQNSTNLKKKLWELLRTLFSL